MNSRLNLIPVSRKEKKICAYSEREENEIHKADSFRRLKRLLQCFRNDEVKLLFFIVIWKLIWINSGHLGTSLARGTRP